MKALLIAWFVCSRRNLSGLHWKIVGFLFQSAQDLTSRFGRKQFVRKELFGVDAAVEDLKDV